MNIRKIFKRCKHNYAIKKWRLVHIGGEPSTRLLGLECKNCGKRIIHFNVERDKKWEQVNEHLRDTKLWDFHWERKGIK